MHFYDFLQGANEPLKLLFSVLKLLFSVLTPFSARSPEGALGVFRVKCTTPQPQCVNVVV